jgi:ABC-type transport system involved in multi-copper enzyme maturation permease subunit
MTVQMTTTDQPRVTARGTALGEWIKLRSVRSTVITLLGGAVATVFFGAVFALSAGGDGPGAQGPPGASLTDPVAISLGGINVTQLVIGIVGVLIVAGEYSTGLIRTTFTAVGSRIGVLRAKASVLAIVVVALMGVATTLAVIVGQAVYAGDEPTVSLADPDLWGVIAGTTFYLMCVSLIGVALGFLLRSTAGAIGILVVGLFVGPTLLGLLPEGFTDATLKYLPSKAGESLMAIEPGADLLSTGGAIVALILWVLVLLGAAAFELRRRDA